MSIPKARRFIFITPVILLLVVFLLVPIAKLLAAH